MSMDNGSITEIGLKAWYLLKKRDGQTDGGKPGHLSGKTLYELALSGAITASDTKYLSHLSLCPLCFSRWADLCRGVSDVEDSIGYEEKKTVSWGMLEAAASDEPLEAVRLKSCCGRFFLALMPELENPLHGMITLELAPHAAGQFEGCKARVMDHSGQIILEGSICQGRLARKIDNVSEVNLSRWIVTIG